MSKVLSASIAYPFLSQFDRVYTKHQRYNTNPGDAVVPLYSARYDPDGIITLRQDGQHNLYEEIQSHRDSTDLALIINRYFNGDPTALSRVQGTYADITNMPTNIHEAMSLVDNARKDFDSLPVDIKALFDNDANQFLATLGTEEWFSKMQIPRDTDSSAADPAVESSAAVPDGGDS